MSIAIRKQSLSKKEQDAKNRLYGKGAQQQQPIQQNSPPTKDNTRDQNSNFQKVYQAPSNEQIDQFLKNVENDFQQVSQKQVTIGMLSTQQELIRQQNEIVMKNQQQLAQYIAQPQKKQTESPEGNQQQFLALLEPINAQLRDIKQLYQQTKQNTIQLQEQLQNGNSTTNFQECQQQNNKLKQLLETTQNNLTYVQPENFQALQNFTDFNLRLYQDTINNLQSQINALQNEAMSTEQELNVRYKQLNDARLGHKIKQGKQAEEENLKQLQQQINSINFEQSKQWLNSRLGGEFDYDALVEETSQITSQITDLIADYKDLGHQYEIQMPEFKISHQEMEALNNKPTSILEEMKQMLGIPNKPYKQQQQQQQQQQLQQIVQTQQDMQKKTNKPTHLQNIVSKPNEPPKDVKFEKQQNTANYSPITKERPSETKEKERKQETKRTEVKQEKLKYRKQSKELVEKKNYGVIQYLDQDQSEEEDVKVMISYKPPNQKNLNNNVQQNSSKKKAQEQKIQVESEIQFKHPNQQSEDIQDIYHHQQIKEQYQETPNDPKFINYDDLINQVQQKEYFGSQEQKSTALLERLGIKQDNPKNEYELIELLSRDIVKQKLQMQQNQQVGEQQYKKQVQETIQKNQSVQIIPEQPSIQDQVAQGAQAFFQGLLQAFNNTLTQVNQGVAINKAPQQQQFQQFQYQYEESEYSDESQDQVKVETTKINQQQVNSNMQQYTFSQTFQQPQKPQTTVDLKDYYKNFEIESQNSQLTYNRSGSYNGSVFKYDDSYGQKSDGQISIPDVNTNRRQQVTKDIFKGLNEDLSDGEVPIYKTKEKK